MAFTGIEFYNRLSEVCKAHGTSVTALLLDLGKPKSLGSSIQKAKKPNVEVANAAAGRFGVSASWLLGIQESPHDSGLVKLNESEMNFINRLRMVNVDAQSIILNIALSTIDNIPLLNSKTLVPFSLSPKGKHVTQEKKPDPVLASNPKLRQLGVSKGAHTVAYRNVEGKAAAGTPRAAVREDDRQIVVPVKYTGEQYFIVQAEGDSMTGIVSDGDFCVFDKHGHFDNGRVCLVQADGATDEPDAMIKRVFRRGDRVELRSENRKYPPRFYPVEEVVLMGELVKVLPPEACMPPVR